jgi:hypothetical protein
VIDILNRIEALVLELGIPPDRFLARVRDLYGARDTMQLRRHELQDLEERLLAAKARRAASR